MSIIKMTNKKTRLKVSFLLPSNGVGGGVRAIVRFGNELMARGHHVRIFYRDDVHGVTAKLRRIYLQLRGLTHDWLQDFKGSSSKYKKLDPAIFSPDEVIVSMCGRTTLDTWSLPENVGIKVLHCHGAEIGNWELMLKAWKLPIPKIVVSSHLIGMIKREVSQGVIGVAPDGVDTSEYFSCLPDRNRIGIGAAFRWGPSKDPVSTIRVMQILRQRLPGVPLYSYGSGRKSKGLKNVIYRRQPTILEARKTYSNCKVWFLMSINEGFGLPVLEAMACGCAVVSTDCGGPRDVIVDGVNGFLVDVGNTGAMVHKIMTLYQDDDLRRYICQNGVKTAREFTWSKGAAKLEKYLISIHDNKIHEGKFILTQQKRISDVFRSSSGKT